MRRQTVAIAYQNIGRGSSIAYCLCWVAGIVSCRARSDRHTNSYVQIGFGGSKGEGIDRGIGYEWLLRVSKVNGGWLCCASIAKFKDNCCLLSEVSIYIILKTIEVKMNLFVVA